MDEMENTFRSPDLSQQLFASEIDAIVLVDSNSRQILDVNDTACRLYGYSREEFLALNAIELSAEPNKSRASIERTIAARRDRVALRYHKKKDGTIFPVELSAGVFSWQGREIICSTFRDISERKQMEEVLQQNVEKYSHLFHNLGDAVFVHDLQGNMIDVNKKALDLFGYSKPELLALGIAQLHPPEELETSEKAFTEIAREGSASFEAKFIKKNGAVFLAEVSSTLFTFGENRIVQGIVRDITKRREAEERVRLLSSITRQSTEGIALADMDGNLKFVNEACAELHGYTQEELLGKHLSVFHTPEQMLSVDGVNKQIKETGKFLGEIWHVRRDGTIFPTIMNNNLLHDRDGNPAGIIGMMRDITERKQAEEALRESEERFRLLSEAAEEGIVIHDMGKIVDANEAIARMFGYQLSEMIDMSADSLLTPESKNIMMENVAEGIRKPYELVGIKKDGSTLYCEVEGKPFNYHGRQLRVAAVRDISSRRKAEEALRESEERFRVFFQTSPDVMTISDLSTGEFIDVNKGFVDLTGYSREEAIGRSAIDFELWYDPHIRDRMIAELNDRGYVKNLETKFRQRNGTIISCLISANIMSLQGKTYLFSVVRNIEDLKRAEKAVRESEERFRTIFESAHDAIFIKDRNLRYVAVNPSMQRLFDIEPDRFVGKSYEEILGSEGAGHNRDVERRVLNGKIVSEESHRTIDGEEYIFHIITVPMRDADNEIFGLCGIARDITETRRLQKSAERAQRLESAGRIAGQVAHDFNNLLGPLIAYPGLMRDELSQNHPVMVYLDDIEKAAEQMADINQQLLTLGRRGHYNLEPLNINAIIRQAIDRSRPHPEGVILHTDLLPGLMNINGGSSQIYRVISNLLTNALDSMAGGGRLTIKTENYYVNDDSGAYSRVSRGEYVKVTVSDTGGGIPDEYLPNIFDPFFTTKTADRKRGTGLGLSIVHTVAEDHKGYIDVDSQPGEGTSFYLYFPITRDEAETVEAESITGGTEKVMVVDDDPIQIEVALRLLRKLGYTVRTAESGERGLELLQNNPQDLLIVDMIMSPGIDGAETIKRALDISPNQKSIIVSGFAESDRVQEALNRGAGNFLKKPLTFKLLALAVRKELDRKTKKAPR